MSSGSSDSKSTSECEFKTTSESDKESIRGCYNNEAEYSQEEIDKMEEKNGSTWRVPTKENVPRKMILRWVIQHGVPVRTASFMRI